MKGRWIHFVAACAVLAVWAAAVQADPPPPTLWTRQICSTINALDWASGIAADGGGNVYVAGSTGGDLGGANQGGVDAFLLKYDGGGTEQWVRQFGTIKDDAATGIAVDSSGNSFITGHTDGDLGGPPHGSSDAFIIACDSGGTTQWSTQIGTGKYEWVAGIALDGSGNIYITGSTDGDLGGPNQGGYDAFIAKFDSGGTVQWTRQMGSTDRDYGQGIAVDGSGNSYIAGHTSGDLAGPNQGYHDAFIAKYDSAGTEQWRRQIGTTAWDSADGIAVDASGNSYIAGYTTGDLAGPSQGDRDAFVAKYDSSGEVDWIRQLGGGEHVSYYYTGVATDSSGNAYVTGQEEGDLLAKYGSDGTQQWKRFAPSPSDAAVDAGGNVYVTGNSWELAHVLAVASYPATAGDATLNGCVDGLDYVIWSNNYHLSDQWWEEGDFTGEGYVDGLDYIAWSNNYNAGCPAAPGPVPEPATLVLLGLGGAVLIRRRQRAA